jgi:type II secretion system protein D
VLGPQVIQERIELIQNDGNVIANLYRKWTGRRVIVSSAAAQATITFIQDPPLTHEEAAELLKKACLLEGLVFVPSGPNIDKLVFATGGPNPKGIGLPMYLDLSELPEGDEVIQFVMLLDYIKPDEAVRTFTQVIGQFGAYGSIAAVPNASAIVITENTQLIRSLIELKERIDVPSAQISTRFVKVEHADVTELAETLNELLNTQQQQQRSAGVTRQGTTSSRNLPPGVSNPAAAAAAAATGATGGSAGEDTPVQIVPESRTNRIFVMGRPIDVIFVEGLIREFDTQTDRRNYLRRKLKYLAVSDFLPIAEDALARTMSTTSQSGGGRISGGSSSRSSSSSSRTQQTSAQRGSTSRSSGRDSGFGGGASGAGSVLSDPDVSSAPESLLIGRTLLVADNISNSIVVQGPPQSLEIITQLLDEIDVKSEQVMISTVFGQLTLTDGLDYGFDWAFTADANNSRPIAGQNRNTPAASGDLIIPGTLITPDLFPNAATGLSVYGQLTEDLFGYLKALESTGRFDVLSRPTVFTSNNQRATISSGQRIAVPTNSYQGGTTGQSTNIEYRDVVLSLEVIPLVNSEDEVTLTVALLNDDAVGSQFIEGVGEVPTIQTQELVTTVTVPDESTVVLGGLITVSDETTVSGIPILSSIPGIGKLFSRTSTTEERQELIIFIQPKIVNSDQTLAEAQRDMDFRYDSAPEVRQMGAGPPAVLPARGTVNNTSQAKAVGTTQPAETGKKSRKMGRPGSIFSRRR